MKTIALITVGLIWISSLIILIISLTDIYPENNFKEHRLIIGIAFITITGLLKPIYKSVTKKDSNVGGN
ncbi:hypothetical protein [Yeosuana marina]|uniref:hypothetical protein n=1 Tax=Yeosuana marina TaxID=1565536 RepID=UPI0030EEA894|tara:strand:- start:9812 stop:10018 length:207 start_codon:yes stop_codon:yes gene_type:complete